MQELLNEIKYLGNIVRVGGNVKWSNVTEYKTKMLKKMLKINWWGCPQTMAKFFIIQQNYQFLERQLSHINHFFIAKGITDR